MGRGGEPVSAQPGPAADEPDTWGLTPEAPPAAAKPKAVKKKPSAATPEGLEYLRCVDAYFVAYEKARGVKPIFTGADPRALRRLLDAMKGDAARVILVIENAFTDAWWASRASLMTIAKDPARFEGLRPARRVGAHMQKAARNADGSLKEPELVDLDD